MEYALAQELRDAGFPQEAAEHGSQYALPIGHVFMEEGWRKDLIQPEIPCKIPTLEELIKECGDISIQMGTYSDGAYPKGKKCYAWHGDFHGFGMNLKIAMSRFYLALNKKTVPTD